MTIIPYRLLLAWLDAGGACHGHGAGWRVRAPGATRAETISDAEFLRRCEALARQLTLWAEERRAA